MEHSLRFSSAITALVNAFYNETLAKGNCAACAVGNMVAFANGAKLDPDLNSVSIHKFGKELRNTDWKYFGMTIANRDSQLKRSYLEYCSIEESDAEQIELAQIVTLATGYSEEEILRIEHAFETNTKIDFMQYTSSTKESIMLDQYNGLMAVVDVLCEIEGIESSNTKELFVLNTI